ncbi:MAG: DUF4878 domain-containing protein [Pseudomonadota bacterium]
MTLRFRLINAARRRGQTLALAGVMALAVAGCGGPEGAARDAATKWMDDLNAGNVTAAIARSTEPTQALLQMGTAMGQSMGPGEYEITGVEMTGENTARVIVKSAKDGADGPSTLDLVRVDGEWKVGMRK